MTRGTTVTVWSQFPGHTAAGFGDRTAYAVFLGLEPPGILTARKQQIHFNYMQIAYRKHLQSFFGPEKNYENSDKPWIPQA